MCDPATLAIIVGATASTAATAVSLTKGAPKIPAPPAAQQSPTANAFMKKNAAAFNPGAALASGGPVVGSGSGPSQNVGTSTLLGQ